MYYISYCFSSYKIRLVLSLGAKLKPRCHFEWARMLLWLRCSTIHSNFWWSVLRHFNVAQFTGEWIRRPFEHSWWCLQISNKYYQERAVGNSLWCHYDFHSVIKDCIDYYCLSERERKKFHAETMYCNETYNVRSCEISWHNWNIMFQISFAFFRYQSSSRSMLNLKINRMMNRVLLTLTLVSFNVGDTSLEAYFIPSTRSFAIRPLLKAQKKVRNRFSSLEDINDKWHSPVVASLFW